MDREHVNGKANRLVVYITMRYCTVLYTMQMDEWKDLIGYSKAVINSLHVMYSTVYPRLYL